MPYSKKNYYQPDDHAERCRERYSRSCRDAAMYRELWPNHCPHCGGSGEIEVNDEIDFCDHCLGMDRCPRCGGRYIHSGMPLAIGSGSTCPHCDWEIAENMECPRYAECCCEEEG